MLVEPTQTLLWIPFGLKQEGDCSNCSIFLAHFKICLLGGCNEYVKTPGNNILWKLRARGYSNKFRKSPFLSLNSTDLAAPLKFILLPNLCCLIAGAKFCVVHRDWFAFLCFLYFQSHSAFSTGMGKEDLQHPVTDITWKVSLQQKHFRAYEMREYLCLQHFIFAL